MAENNILQYESKVWATADLLIGAGIKQSDFPKYMMPFFALIMVESRLIREAERLEQEIDRKDIEDFIDEFKDLGLGYNDYVIRKQKTLTAICQNDKTFEVDFIAYLRSFDMETKSLLGVDKGTDEEKFLDISGISGLLNKKRILFATAKAWSEIDLKPFSNSEITTLEEHIKRKWADISAETAGEQYTPDDIISLASEIIVSKIDDSDLYLTIYDPTCGGGNMLFGVEDKIKNVYNRPTKTFGQDWSDSLYALAKIESRFRTDSDIQYGNTLTDILFIDKRFDVAVANPPYGVDWKGYQSDILNDKTERFVALPAISDGQLLFTQHILYQLTDTGIAIVVHNGSTLFSGDAGSGESEIRKYFFENDWVEAIIQMPTDEFFNTGIYTYLWIFNKNKAKSRKDKLILINGSDFFVPLKKSKGKKRKEMSPQNRQQIVEALTNFVDTDYARVFDKWEFYYNKQFVMLTNLDDQGRSFEDQLLLKKNKSGEMVREKNVKLSPVKIVQQDEEDNTIEINDFYIETFDKKKFNNLKDLLDEYYKPLIEQLDYKENHLTVFTEDGNYTYVSEKDTLAKAAKEDWKKGKQLGCGKIVVKATLKKATKTKKEAIEISVELTPDYQKDYEIIPFSPIESQNIANRDTFMKKYVSKPFEYLDNIVGVEINFNKIFYKPQPQPDVASVLSELEALEKELKSLESNLNL